MKEAIEKLLKKAPGLKGKQIAKKLGYDKKEVNSFLYANLDSFLRDDNYCWSLVPPPEIRIEFESINGWTANHLKAHYLVQSYYFNPVFQKFIL